MHKRYCCSWPECHYYTRDRRKIDMHHITPREVDPSPLNKAVLSLCPTHHSMIFHPGATSGRHAHWNEGSMEIVGVHASTVCKGAKVVQYIVCGSGREIHYCPETKTYLD